VGGSILVLASGSPRRSELLTSLGLEFVTSAPDVDESVLDGELPTSYVTRVSLLKVTARALVDMADGVVVLAADTTVVLDGQILGKPADAEEAVVMLEALSGRTHRVLTGVAVASGERQRATVVETKVEFAQLDRSAIDWYVSTGEPFDKAGGYGIQGAGGAFVKAIAGSASNVIGLPLVETSELLAAVGHPVASFRS
jgi:septum formation protein